MSCYYAIVLTIFIAKVASQYATVCDEAQLYTFIPDVRDCNAWFFCDIKGPVRGTCSNQYLFNPRTRLCDWPHNVDCFKCPSNVGLHQIPMKGSCRSFIRCINGYPTQNICENGLQFNKVTGQCDLPKNVECQTGFRCPDELPTNGTIIAMRDNYNCSVYHACVGDSESVRQECNPELHFDPLTFLCTYPDLTYCPIIQYPDGPGSGPEPEYESTTEYPTPFPTDTVHGVSTESRTESPTEPPTKELISQFECSFDGIHPHPTECSEYFICMGNMPQLMKCAEGLHFNVVVLHCDSPENANCDFYNTII